jgi:hypothetical protein
VCRFLGFRNPIVLYSRETAFGYPEYSCYQESSAKEQSSTADYQSSLSQDASVSGGASFGAGSCAFSASAGTTSFQQDVEGSSSVRYTLTSYCLKYFFGVRTGETMVDLLTKNFADEAANLPVLHKEPIITTTTPPATTAATVAGATTLAPTTTTPPTPPKTAPTAAPVTSFPGEKPTTPVPKAAFNPGLIFWPPCSETADNCKKLAAENECATNGIFMMENCMKSCGLCGIKNCPKASVVPTLAPAFPAAVGVSPSLPFTPLCDTLDVKCKDEVDNCIALSAAGRCNEPEIGSKCTVTCGLCILTPAVAVVDNAGDLDLKPPAKNPMEYAWFEFFDRFGTHCKFKQLSLELFFFYRTPSNPSVIVVVSSLHLGGKLIHESIVEKSEITKARSSGLSVKASIEGSYGPVNAAASYSRDQSQSSNSAQSKSNMKVKSYVFGGNPPEDFQATSAFKEVRFFNHK